MRSEWKSSMWKSRRSTFSIRLKKKKKTLRRRLQLNDMVDQQSHGRPADYSKCGQCTIWSFVLIILTFVCWFLNRSVVAIYRCCCCHLAFHPSSRDIHNWNLAILSVLVLRMFTVHTSNWCVCVSHQMLMFAFSTLNCAHQILRYDKHSKFVCFFFECFACCGRYLRRCCCAIWYAYVQVYSEFFLEYMYERLIQKSNRLLKNVETTTQRVHRHTLMKRNNAL